MLGCKQQRVICVVWCSGAGDIPQTAAVALINDFVRGVYCMATLAECRRDSGAVNLINLSFFLYIQLSLPRSLPSRIKGSVFGTGARGVTNPQLIPVSAPVFLLFLS